MLATESEPANCDSAVRNVENNELTQRIKVRKVEKGDRIFDSALADGETVEFSMCNPPFFSEERVEEDDEGESGGGKEAGQPSEIFTPAHCFYIRDCPTILSDRGGVIM